MRSGLRARTSPTSSSRTATAGRPSIASTQGPWLAVTSWTGPIGVQPWERPVISGTSAVIRTPEIPPSVGRPAICSSEPLAEVRPPTRNAPLPALSRATVSAAPPWRGSPCTTPKRPAPLRPQAAICRSRSSGSSRRPSNSRKLCSGRLATRVTIAPLPPPAAMYSWLLAQTPAPPVPTQSRTPVASASRATIRSRASASGSLA